MLLSFLVIDADEVSGHRRLDVVLVNSVVHNAGSLSTGDSGSLTHSVFVRGMSDTEKSGS